MSMRGTEDTVLPRRLCFSNETDLSLRSHDSKFSGRVSENPVAVASPFLLCDVIGSQSDALPADGKEESRGAQ